VIDLLASDGRAGFGVACALDIERIPYRRITRAEEFGGSLLVIAGAPVTAEVVALAHRVPSVVLGSPELLPRELFGVTVGRTITMEAEIALADPIWPDPVRAAARSVGKTALRLPPVSVFAPNTRPDGTVLAALRRPHGRTQTAIVENGGCHWCLIDLGTAFAELLDEGTQPASRRHTPRALRRPAFEAYYRAPEAVRQKVQRRLYRRLHAELGRRTAPSEYPVDATGWLLLELLKQLVRTAAGSLVRIARWPAPFTAAAALTHDLEPTRFAYTEGLDRLSAQIAEGGHAPTFGVVAGPARRYLGAAAVERLAQQDVLCHGLEHRGETHDGSREEIARGIALARAQVEEQLERPVVGFRSPRLDRSPDLLWALDRAGLSYDSSYPDVDRENLTSFGGGVRLNVPYRPPIEEGSTLRPSRCLELPVSAPDCIQPLFEGDDVKSLRRAVRAKIAFVRATGGLYMGIVHAGVFDARDAARRGAHLAFVHGELVEPHPGAEFWRAAASDIAAWWCAREQVDLALGHGVVVATNRGDTPVENLRLILETTTDTHTYDLPTLAPGTSLTIELEPVATAERA
jgi:hypothetical protein